MVSAWQPEPAVLGKFLIGFEGTTLPAELRYLLPRGLAGVAIFRRNWKRTEDLRALSEEVRAAAARPVLIGIDQEGGRKFALPEPFTPWPPASELGRLGDAALVEDMARAMARELRAVGCNLNFAPMLDLHLNPSSPVTTERSFGSDPNQVARLGAAFLRGLAAEGVLGCAKHFPGHGDAQVDPHEDLPVFHGDGTRLEQVELVPFAGAVAAGAPMVMTAHILLPKIDPEQPASLSPKLLRGTLRGKLGFAGVILADDLGMGAIRRRYGLGDATVRAIQAGSDLVALCHDWSAVRPAIEAVEEALRDGLFAEADRQASHARIARLCRQASSGSEVDLNVIGCAAHCALSAEIRARIERI